MTRTNLIKNPSFEVDTAGYWNGTRVTTEAYTGSASLQVGAGAANNRLTGYGATSGATANADAIATTPGEAVTFSIYLKAAASGPSIRLKIHWFNSAGAWLSDYDGAAVVPGTSWARQSISATAPASAAKFGVVIFDWYGGSAGTIYTDGWMVEKSATLGGYFDGSSILAGQTHAWTGTAHGSTSTQTPSGGTVRTNFFKTPSLESNLPGMGAVTQAASTTVGVIAGTKSLALTASGASNDSYAETNSAGTLYSGVTADGLVAGTTYTISAYLTLTAPITGTLHARALRIDVFTKVGAAAYVESMTTQAANVAGTTRVSGQFTVPVGVTELFFRFYHGGTGGTVYWDGVLVEAGTVLGAYFDGSMVTAGYVRNWTGPAHDSTSQEELTAVRVTLKSREAGAWVSRSAVPKVRVAGAWVIKRPKRWNASASVWVDLN